jgi:predicted ATPase
MTACRPIPSTVWTTMRLTAIYSRFFRSLNFDFVKKSSEGYKPRPWDVVPGTALNYPFVKVVLESSITTIVGANESGKSQVLAAIEAAISGKGILQKDFCRYSPYFLKSAVLTLPEFGLGFTDVTASDVTKLQAACGSKVRANVPDEVLLFRMNSTPKYRAYLRYADAWNVHNVVTPSALNAIGIPSVIKIDATTPLPDSVSIDFIASGAMRDAVPHGKLREKLDELLSHQKWYASPESITANIETVRALLQIPAEDSKKEIAKYKLARTLLVDVAGVEPSTLTELKEAIRVGNSGYANSIIDAINAKLSDTLNFAHWWKQDATFELFVRHQEYHLEFMIRDRTGRSYSFDERSGGIKYFLSYFVQYLAHKAEAVDTPQILLMDEPDAYLSASGQQDLLRIFQAFAFPEDDTPAVQVAYVTHSPFLIDKNHAERIRVLEKGRHDEGTRVVANASRNHFEPLRTALGEFVAETTFMGGCNLIVEGASDQVLLAGMSNYFRSAGRADVDNIDLNEIVIVPAGSASHIPYMSYLARGRDVDKPAVIVLLDSDSAGNDAAKLLRSGGPRGKQLVPAEYIAQVGAIHGITATTENMILGIEDLIPLEICLLATRSYCEEFTPDITLDGLEVEQLMMNLSNKGNLDTLQEAVRTYSGEPEFHLDKIGFARNLMSVMSSDGPTPETRELFERNFAALLSSVAKMQRDALRVQSAEAIKDRISRVRDRFEKDTQGKPLGRDVVLLMEELGSQLDNSEEADLIRARMLTWNHKYQLIDDPSTRIQNPQGFADELRRLAYAGLVNAQETNLSSPTEDSRPPEPMELTEVTEASVAPGSDEAEG